MRDPKRIKEFCDQLAVIWETNCPDWRFGQFICNVFGGFRIDPFYPEEDMMLKMIDEYFHPKKKEDKE